MAPLMIAIDWGSSAFRAFLLDDQSQVLARKSTADGVLTNNDASYNQVIIDHCGEWLEETPSLPIIMGGAIGSRNGWKETPYIDCPASIETLARSCVEVELGVSRDIQIVPGVTGPNFFGGADVMRGEEVQVFGALRALGLSDGLVCLPGTHSKWCLVKGGEITSLTTFMTGEMFALIRRQSSIGLVIDDAEFERNSFSAGLAAASDSAGLLHQLFSVRADILLGNLKVASAESYLSGMLIGCEIKAVRSVLGDDLSVVLVGNEGLTQRYAAALDECSGQSVQVSGDEAFIRGILLIRGALAQPV